MEKTTLADHVRLFIRGIAWRVFIWSLGKSEEQYWHEIYEQERRLHENQPLSPDVQ